MAIDYGRLRTLTAREMMAGLLRDGFLIRKGTGGHQRFRHSDGRRVTVAFHHPGQTFAPGTLRRMVEDQARWTASDLERLGLI